MSRPRRKGSASGPTRLGLIVAIVGLAAAALGLLNSILQVVSRFITRPIPDEWLRPYRVPLAIGLGLFVTFISIYIILTTRRILRDSRDEHVIPDSDEAVADTERQDLPIDNLPNRAGSFTGRESLLAQLDHLLTAKPSGKAVALCGLEGVGRMEIALEYAARWSDRYLVRWWISAEQPGHVVSGLTALAAKLGLSAKASPLVLAAEIRDELNRRGLRWLLIFSNGDHPSDVIPYLAPLVEGHVLITSCNPSWSTLVRVIPVDPLPIAEATRLLLTHTGSTDQAAAAELADELHRLPLALAQAVACIVETPGMTLRGYLGCYRRTRQRMQASAPGDYQAVVATTTRLSLQQLRKTAVEAADLLRLCAFLGPGVIPSQLLSIGGPRLPRDLGAAVRDGDALQEMAEDLTRLALAASERDGIRVHRQVQAVIRRGLDRRQAHMWPRIAVDVVSTAVPDTPAEPRHSHRLAWLLPHVLAVSDHGSEVAPDAVRELLTGVGIHLGNNARNVNDLLDSVERLEEGVELAVRFYGADHPVVARSLRALGAAQGNLHRFAAARATLERALSILETTYGPDDPRVAYILVNLGNVLRGQRDSVGAYNHLKRALTILEATFGRDGREVACALASLATVLADLGELSAARRALEHVLAIEERSYGSQDVEVARTLFVLAQVLHRQQEFGAALSALERARGVFWVAYGPDHPEVARASIELSRVLFRLGGHRDGWKYLVTGVGTLGRAILVTCREVPGRRRTGPDQRQVVEQTA